MLAYPTENEIIEAVVKDLQSKGFKILSTCNTQEQGIDIVAVRGNTKMLIEAKGGTSSKATSNHFGKPFTRNQAHVHISVAIYTVMSYLSNHSEVGNLLIGIALPYEKNHLEFIERVKPALKKLGVIIFWVNDGVVRTESFSEENGEDLNDANSISGLCSF